MRKVSSDLLLLDVNVLLAIAWPNHQFHLAAVSTWTHSQRRPPKIAGMRSRSSLAISR